jgi:hypothetical protein
MDVTGFRVLETACFYGSYAQSASSVRFWMRDKLGHAGIRRLLERLLFTRPMRVAFLPLFFVLDRLQKSSSLTVVCAPAGKGEVGDSAEVGTVEQ